MAPEEEDFAFQRKARNTWRDCIEYWVGRSGYNESVSGKAGDINGLMQPQRSVPLHLLSHHMIREVLHRPLDLA